MGWEPRFGMFEVFGNFVGGDGPNAFSDGWKPQRLYCFQSLGWQCRDRQHRQSV